MSEEPQSSALLLLIGAITLLLVGVSFAVSYGEHTTWSSIVAIGISTIKAMLIVWFFMEMREARTSVRVAALGGLLLFGLLLGLTVTDVATRRPAPLQVPMPLHVPAGHVD